MKKIQKSFAAGYTSTCPEAIQAIIDANIGHEPGYGKDKYTTRAVKLFKKEFGENVEPFMVYNGSAANVFGLKAALKSYQSIICADTAYMNTHTAGSIENYLGSKLLTIDSQDGKITIDQIKTRKALEESWGFHTTIPHVVSITQSTEYGTIYTKNEVRKIAEYCHKNDLLLHMDGCRLGYAAINLNCSLKEISFDAGVDILAFGGSKFGLLFGEAVIFAHPELAKDFKHIQKQAFQLHWKHRYLAAQFIVLFQQQLWKKSCAHANNMCKILAKGISKYPQIKITQKVETNYLYCIIPKTIIRELQNHYPFFVWNQETGEVRLATSWDSTEEDVKGFLSLIEKKLT